MYQYPGQMGVAPGMQVPQPGQMYGVPGQPMQQSPNFVPQVPSGVPQGVSQGNYAPALQNPMRVRPVASYDEAKAVPTDFMGNLLVLTDLSHGCIYTKVLDPATGSSIFRIYKEVVEPAPQPEPVAPPVPMYDPKAEIERLRSELEGIKHELGLDSKEEQK